MEDSEVIYDPMVEGGGGEGPGEGSLQHTRNPTDVEVEMVEVKGGGVLDEDFGFEHTLFEAETGFRCVGVSPDKRFVVAGGRDGFIYMKETSKAKKVEDDMGEEVEGKEEGDVRKVELERRKEVKSVTFGRDEGGSRGGGSVVYVGMECGKVYEVNLSRGEVVRTFTGHKGSVYGLALSPNSKTLLSGSDDKTAHFWDLTKGAAEGGDVAPIKVIEEENEIWCVAYNPDGTKFCLGGGLYEKVGFLHVYDSTSYEHLAELEGHTNTTCTLEFSLDGTKLFSGSSDNTVKIWDVAAKDAETWACKKTLVGHSASVWRVSESPCDKHLTSGSGDKTVKVWDITTGSELRTIKAHEECVYGVSFEKGGRIISASTDGKVKLWNLATKGRDALKLEGHERDVKAVAISADGRTVVSCGWDNKVHIWDTKTRKLKVKLEGHRKGVPSVAISRDGSLVISGSKDRIR